MPRGSGPPLSENIEKFLVHGTCTDTRPTRVEGAMKQAQPSIGPLTGTRPVMRAQAASEPCNELGDHKTAVHVLLVDDNHDLREMYAEYLQLHGMRVEQAASGERAIELAVAFGPDVVLMDMCMPGMGGCEAARRLAGFPFPPRIVAVSADDSNVWRDQACAAGCSAFFPKPFSPERLVAIVLAAYEAG